MKTLIKTRYVTDINQVLKAIGIAAVVGAAIFPGALILVSVVDSLLVEQPSLAGLGSFVMALVLAPVLVMFAALVWTLGIACVGGPAWWLLHVLGLRGWPWATLTGGVVLAGFVLSQSLPEQPFADGFADLIQTADVGMLIMSAGVGAGLGYLIWRIAYRPRPAETR
jgi:hypothetical protein